MKYLLFALLFAGLGCAPQPATPLVSRSIDTQPAIQSGLRNAHAHQRKSVLTKAKQLLLRAGPFTVGDLKFERNAIGFVQAAYWHAGIDVFDAQLALKPEISGTELAYGSAKKRRQLFKKLPRPGDLVFFKSSHATKNSELPPKQIAIVETIDRNLTATALGIFSNGAKRIVFNLTQKKRDFSTDGKRINDRLSSLQGEKGEAAGYLLKEFANPFLPHRQKVTRVDSSDQKANK